MVDIDKHRAELRETLRPIVFCSPSVQDDVVFSSKEEFESAARSCCSREEFEEFLEDHASMTENGGVMTL